ncbi:MAG: guanylate kinase [Oscillospiraceae bacterium]|nr:guanylate kinase [Oscillospiraceae bacterium]
MKKGLLIVVSGPSGCGKGTVLGDITRELELSYSVSATTRSMREGEIDGVNYHYMSKESFEKLIAEDKVLEYTEYCGNYYGTLREEVENRRNQGQDVLLEIEVVGAANVKRLCPDAVLIFIAPPSVQELERRLRKRGTETDEVIAERVSQAEREIRCSSGYDYIIVNGELEKAVNDVKSVIIAERISAQNKEEIISEVLNS